MTRRIPIDKSKPSAFLFGLLRMTRYLLPETEMRISEFEEQCKKIVFGPAEKKIETLESQIQDLIAKKEETSSQLSDLQTKEVRLGVLKSGALLAFPVICLYCWVFLFS
jgi:hypothetical protein